MNSFSETIMPCMPYITTFQLLLGSLDKTKPVRDRVEYVLTAMGISKKEPEKRMLIKSVVNSAVNVPEITQENYNNIFASINAQIVLYKFIQEFLEVNGYNDLKVEVFDFLKDFQKAVLTEEELSNLK